jgi:glycerophosphoryl diester phosphodiesterase
VYVFDGMKMVKDGIVHHAGFPCTPVNPIPFDVPTIQAILNRHTFRYPLKLFSPYLRAMAKDEFITTIQDYEVGIAIHYTIQDSHSEDARVFHAFTWRVWELEARTLPELEDELRKTVRLLVHTWMKHEADESTLFDQTLVHDPHSAPLKNPPKGVRQEDREASQRLEDRALPGVAPQSPERVHHPAVLQ